MKNLKHGSILLLLAACLLTACEQAVVDDDSPTTTNGTKNVEISVADIEAGWSASHSRSPVSVAQVCSRLCFAVYQDGKRIKYKNQAAGDTDFGTLSLQLDEGTYQLLALAHSGAANPATTNPAKVQFTNPESSGGTGFTDTFYYYGTLTVGSSGIRQNISLERATSMFRLVTKDAKPDAVRKMQFYYTGGSGALDATTGLGCVDSKQSVFVTFDDNYTGKTVEADMYTFLHAETGKLTFTVRAFDAKDNLLYQKEFTNVAMKRNAITRYTGNFFTTDEPAKPADPGTKQSDDPTYGTVMVDPEWADIVDFNF